MEVIRQSKKLIWFDFVILNRNLESTERKHDYDIIEGPVADDKVQRCITRYLEGKISREEFFSQFEPSHQICFCTINSLRMLKKTNYETIFKIEDISEAVIERLILDLNVNETQAADLFYSSETFGKLANVGLKLYLKPWQEIYRILKKEIEIIS